MERSIRPVVSIGKTRCSPSASGEHRKDAILADAINEQATVFGKHVDLELPQPLLIVD